MDILNILKSLDYKNINPEDFLELIDDIPLCPIMFTVSKGSCIERARSGKFYKKRSQMTYCPIERCTKIQRATLPGKTMFYGAISEDEDHLENARIIASAECSKLARGGYNSYGREKITVSKWLVKKPLNVISFVTDKTFPEITKNELLNVLRESFTRNVRNGNIKDVELFNFLSLEFSKKVENGKEYEYLVSATLCTKIIEDIGIDGVIFPSVKLEGQCGLNIVLSTKAVNKKLKFLGTAEQIFYKYYDKGIIDIKKFIKNGEIIFPKEPFKKEQIQQTLGIGDITDLPWI